MTLALAELRRAKGRYLSITGAMALIVFLVLVLGALGDGLFFGSTGAIRSSNASAYAFNSQAPGSLVRSRLTPEVGAQLAAQPGVESVTGLATLTAATDSVPGGADISLIGFDPAGTPVGVPSDVVDGALPTGSGEAAVSDDLAEQGLALGTELQVGGVSSKVVGIVADAGYQGLPTVWTSLDHLTEIRTAVRPETAGAAASVNAYALALDPGTEPASVQLEGVSVLSQTDTYLSIPGVREQRSSINAIVYASLAVGGLVVALFFALVVLEKRELFAALKALGASNGNLGISVIIQALGATASAVVLGAIFARLMGVLLPEDIPWLFRPETLVVSSLLTILAGVLGAVFSLRRISRIDPATALGGTL